MSYLSEIARVRISQRYSGTMLSILKKFWKWCHRDKREISPEKIHFPLQEIWWKHSTVWMNPKGIVYSETRYRQRAFI